jgi:uncharacterized membrane protein (UPF0127 family)
MNIQVGNKQYKVEIASTEEQREKGLQKIKSLPQDEGMLFIFEETEEVSM